MGSLFKKPRSPFWWVRFRSAGKEYRLSSDKTDRKEAAAFLKRKQAEVKGCFSLDEAVQRVLTLLADLPPGDQDKRRADVVRTLLQGHGQRLTFAEAWVEWAKLPMKTGPATIRGYRAVWKRFSAWAAKQGLTCVQQVTETQAQDYAADLWSSRVTASTFNMHKRFLAGLFRRLRPKTGLVSNPWDVVETLENSQESRRDLTVAELQKIIGSATGNLRTMLIVGLFTGLRLADVVNLRRDAVNLEANMIEVVPRKTARKGKRIRVPIHPFVRAHLAPLLRVAAEYLFPEEREQYLKDRGSVTRRIQQHIVNCKIQTTEAVNGSHRRRAIIRVGFHSLRHSFVSLCAAAGAPQHVIQQLVGHGSPAMTEHYTHVDDGQRNAALALLPSLNLGRRGSRGKPVCDAKAAADIGRK